MALNGSTTGGSLAKVPDTFSFTGNEDKWKRWKQKFDIYAETSGISEKTETKKIYALLNLLADDGLDIFETFNIKPTDDGITLKNVLDKFDLYCTPRKNEVFERHKFFTRIQGERESVDTFVTNLKTLARTCDFGDQNEKLIRDKLVLNGNSPTLQEKLLREENLTLKK